MRALRIEPERFVKVGNVYWTEIVIGAYFLIVQMYRHNLPGKERERELHIEEEFRCFLQHCNIY